MISVIIATNNRPEQLRECLSSLNIQTTRPDEIIIAHGGNNDGTAELIKGLERSDSFNIKLHYMDCGPIGAASQRNIGAIAARGEIFFFLDDDVICKDGFIKEILSVFDKDRSGRVGGVSGTIINQTYTPMGKISKLLFNFCLRPEEIADTYAGRVVGPAVNFLPLDGLRLEQNVEWIPSCCSAYRRNVFFEHRFDERFRGYSFMEDVDLSLRVAKQYLLINTSTARVLHKDLGRKTHKDWVAIGKMQVLNRWHVTTSVLHKNTTPDKARFFYYQFYCMITEFSMLFKYGCTGKTLLRWWGRILGCFFLFFYADKSSR